MGGSGGCLGGKLEGSWGGFGGGGLQGYGDLGVLGGVVRDVGGGLQGYGDLGASRGFLGGVKGK